MNKCPVCGYDPDPPQLPVSEAEMRHQRLLNAFSKNLQNSWWLSQPRFICSWLKGLGVEPKSVLDAGCGDGRWVPALEEVWPGSDYVGIDRLEDHISINRETLPNKRWILGDLSKYDARPDLILIAGTFNPGLGSEQEPFVAKVSSMMPCWIVVTFDLNSTGVKPKFTDYILANTLKVPREQSGPFQNLVVWLYGRVPFNSG